MADFISSTLLSVVNQIANEARANASWSTTIPSAIEVGDVVETPTGYEAVIKLNLKKAPHGAAFEFGSGIHSTRGTKRTYEIAPRNVKTLAIPYDSWPSFEPPLLPGPKMIGYGGVGYLLWKVDHPGVEPRPFMTPAVRAGVARLRAELKRSVVASIFVGRKVEVIE